MNALVSIVVPIYNMGNLIERCVESLIDQTYKNIEIILIDDGSKDNSLSVCRKLEKKDNRIKVFHTENKGSGPARNTGIDNASGDYIYFPDADDFLEKDAICKMMAAISSSNCDTLVFGYKSINIKGNMVYKKEYPKCIKAGEDIRRYYSNYVGAQRPLGIQGAPWNKCFSLNLIKKYHIEFPALRRHQDEGFIARYMTYAKKIEFISDSLYIHYVNDLRKEWDKFPVDYIDSVIGLYETRKETILSWNEKDKETRKIINHEYICTVIKALELSFSPKMGFSKKERLKWIKEQFVRSNIGKMTIPSSLDRYHKLILNNLKAGRYQLALCFMHFKIIVEKNGLLHIFRRKS